MLQSFNYHRRCYFDSVFLIPQSVVMSNNTLLPGVVLLSNLVAFNTSLPSLSYVVDVEADITAFLTIALPFIFMWLIGIAFVSYHTDDDGYLTGARSVLGNNCPPAFRFFTQILVYVLEGGQLISCAFGRAATRDLMSGNSFFNPSWRYLWNEDYFTGFPILAGLQIIMMLFMVIPTILWFVLQRSTFLRFTKFYRDGALGACISMVQDCFMVWFVLPITIQLLRGIPCRYYISGEPADALGGATSCGSAQHRSYALAGGIIAALAYMVGMTAGTIPELVKRATDTALNGRYVSVSFAIKAMIAVVYVVASENHPFYHLSFTLFLQMLLLFISISMRPCLIERINFHRSAAFALSIIPTVMCLVATALADPVAVLPFGVGFSFLGAAVILLILKYYTMVCGKLLPEINFNDGKYKGDICLGWNLPHGHGTLDFAESKFTGRFVFGKYDGYGVTISVAEEMVADQYIAKRIKDGDVRSEEEIRQDIARQFFNGMHRDGKRNGFGTTNVMKNPGELSYEGFWRDDMYNGSGTKKFDNGDEFQGEFVDMLEDGIGTWSFDTSLGPHKVTGLWERGIFTEVVLSPDEVYEGETRYGVPHGEGKMTIGDIVFEGEWRAGKMHGLGTVESPEGQYDGNFFEGEYHDQGTWTDDVSVYSGKFKHGLKHGHGREETEDGVYEGMFEEGDRNGYGTFTYSNGAVYQGSWRDGEYSGAGYLKTDEFEFDGVWLNGKRHGGRGHIEYTNGEQYLGGWANDRFQDNGILRLPGLGEFHGTFDNGNKVGLGRFNFLDGSEYIGNWEDDRAHGEGKFVFSSRKAVYLLASMDAYDSRQMMSNSRDRYFLDFGGTYVGEFQAGEMSGEGAVTASDGTLYEGEWQHSVPHGHGVLTYPSGGEYVGEWVNGQREGRGIMEYVDNRSYEGEWLNGRRHGQGVLRAPNGDILHEGDWLADVPVATNRLKVEVEIPTVDVDEFIREIMPAASSATEIEESRFRKRLEIEEVYMRLVVSTILEEELATVRFAKAFFQSTHAFKRAEIVQEESETSRALQKATLAKVLNVFKAMFRYEHDREPKKSDLVNNRIIAPIYRRYQELAQK